MKAKLSPREQRAADALDALYAELPDLECKKLCQHSCGLIAAGRVEWLRIYERLGWEPEPANPCPMLTEDGLCSVYDIRPMICRLWGLTEMMRCPHGCEPERWLTERETWDFLERAGQIAEAELGAVG